MVALSAAVMKRRPSTRTRRGAREEASDTIVAMATNDNAHMLLSTRRPKKPAKLY